LLAVCTLQQHGLATAAQVSMCPNYSTASKVLFFVMIRGVAYELCVFCKEYCNMVRNLEAKNDNLNWTCKFR